MGLNIDFLWIQVYVFKLIITTVITYSIIYCLKASLRHFFKRTDFISEKKENTIESVFRNTTNYIAFFIISLTALNPFIEIKDFLLAGGVIGVIVGFGAQSVIKDFLYGFFFLFEGQFKKGDFVNINGELDGGTVEDLGFRAVKIRLLNGKLMTVSNGEVTKVVNGNIEMRRINESFIISYRENPKKVSELLKEFCEKMNEKHSAVLKNDSEGNTQEPYKLLGLSSLDSSPLGYKFNIVATIIDTEYTNTVFEFRELLAELLFENKIKMPEQNMYHHARMTYKE